MDVPMLRIVFLAAILLCLFPCAGGLESAIRSADADEVRLPRSSPESQGVSSKAIREFIETANQQVDTLHSFMLVRHGHVVPAAWVEQATSKQVSNGSDPARDWDQGYGFQFWRCRHGAYRGDGAFGQFCIVLPEQDSVLAITADTKDMQAELNVVWDKLLPAFHAAALPANANEEVQLKTTLAKLVIPETHKPNTLKLPATK